MSNIEKIEIHAGRPDRPFKELRRLEVKCEASHAFMPAPTVEEANDRLRALASKLNANGVIDTKYDSGMSLTSWKSLKASGLAVIFETDEKVCPECAESIKRAAKTCRYCRAAQDVSEPMIEEGTATLGDGLSKGSAKQNESTTTQQSAPYEEPLRDNNNSAVWWITGIFVFIMLLGLFGI